MNKTTTGWVIFIAALGMMSSLLAVDVAKLNSLHEWATPSFVSSFLAHFGTVVLAFIGGKLIPENRDGQRTRVTDTLPINVVKVEQVAEVKKILDQKEEGGS